VHIVPASCLGLWDFSYF